MSLCNELLTYNYCCLHIMNIVCILLLCSKNENYLARFISFFEKQVGLDLNAEQMITELVRDNA